MLDTFCTVLTIISVAITGIFAYSTWTDLKHGKTVCLGLVFIILYLYLSVGCPIWLSSSILFVPFLFISGLLPYKDDCPYKPTYKGMSQSAWLQLQFDKLHK